jgi:protein SCO1/2
MTLLCSILLWLAVQTPLDRQLGTVAFEQKLGAALPLEVTVRDEAGHALRFGELFGTRPVVLVFAYYTCPNLCQVAVNATLESVRNLPGTVGQDFDIVVVSIDPAETPQTASKWKQTYTARYARPGSAAGWHFLTGDAGAIRALTDAAGYRYFYDTASAQFAHPSGIVIATPDGQVSRYFLGIEYPPKQVRAALADAAQERVGGLTERLLLLCFHYNPSLGRYGSLISHALQVAGVGTALAVGLFMWRGRRRSTT